MSEFYPWLVPTYNKISQTFSEGLGPYVTIRDRHVCAHIRDDLGSSRMKGYGEFKKYGIRRF